jgi:predicted CXXCH cytochrome family protein
MTSQCHSSYLTSAHIHSPVAARACDACHQDDAGGHRYPLKRPGPGDATCTFCHVVAGSAPHQHKAMEQGCGSCHQPHVSAAKFLLKGDSIERVCATCHNIPTKRYAHGPFAQGDCSLCHYSHQADNHFLLRGGAGADHCYLCHQDVRQRLQTAAHVHKPLEQDCATCHDAHTADFPYQLKVAVDQSCLSCHPKVKDRMEHAAVAHSPMTTGASCVNCHDGHASDYRNLMPLRMDKVCLRCHERPIRSDKGVQVAGMRPELTESLYLHGPVRCGGCSTCHDPHGGDRPERLTKAFPPGFYAPFDVDRYALCFGCHNRQMVLTEKTAAMTEFRNGERNLHYLHVHRDDKGRTCRTCHATHGSNLPNRMADRVPFEGSDWMMPIGYEKTADGGRCSPGCHVPMAYGRRSPAAQATTRGAP